MGDFSTVTRKILKHLLDVFCKDIDMRIVFSPFKIKNFFSFKDPIPDALKSLLVYKLLVRDVTPVTLARRHANLSTDKNSHIYKQLSGSPSCNRKCSVDCFKMVDSAKSRHCLKLKKAIYISR